MLEGSRQYPTRIAEDHQGVTWWMVHFQHKSVQLVATKVLNVLKVKGGIKILKCLSAQPVML